MNGLNVNTPAQNCRGNGKSLGLRTTANGFGLMQGGSGGVAYTSAYNVTSGTTPGYNSVVNNGTALGVSTEPSTSGIMRDAVTSTISNYISVKSCIKY